MTDFTEENGATRLIPGSHRFDDKLAFTEADTEPAEMARARCCSTPARCTTAAARTAPTRPAHGVNITYSVGWLRQEENQYLTVPPEVARELPDDLLRLIGYAPRRVRARLRRRPARPARRAPRRARRVELRLGGDPAR